MRKGKKPVKVEDDFSIEETTVLFLCHDCKGEVGSCTRMLGLYGFFQKDKFCRNCGLKIDWSDEDA